MALFNRCPSRKAIKSRNSGLVAMNQVHEWASTAAIGIQGDGTNDTQSIQDLFALDAISRQERAVQRSADTAGKISCGNCLGVVVDLGDGTLHCGIQVPPEVTSRNAKLQLRIEE